MDLGLSEEQELLKNFARDFLEKECPEQHVRDMEEDEQGYTPDLWKKMAEQGWQGLIIPEDNGGSGMGFIDFIILVEEFGRALVPGPFLPTAVGGAIALIEGGSDEQKKRKASIFAASLSTTTTWSRESRASSSTSRPDPRPRARQ